MGGLKNKRILFICPVFYGYHTRIIEALYKNGATQVDFFPERKYNFAYSIFKNISEKLLRLYQSRHYDGIIDDVKEYEPYDYLFVIRGSEIPDYFIPKLKQNHSQIKTIMYQWDSIESNNVMNVANQFDRFFSFDFDDCDKYNFEYYPLYYSIEPENYFTNQKRNDIFFIGSFIYSRYKFLKKLISYCKEHQIQLKHHLYIPKSTYNKWILKGKFLDKNILKFDTMDYDQVLTEIAHSKAVVDVSKKDQTGLSQRVIETRSLNTKLITHNQSISKDKLIYSHSQIAIIDEDDIKIDKSFLESKLETKHNDLNNLFVDNWINHFFSPQ